MTAVPAGQVAGRQQPAAAGAEPLILADLLNDAVTLAGLLATEVERGSRLDAYLLAAGLWQVTEDWLHRDVLTLRKVAGTLRRAGRPGRLAARVVLALRAIGLRARRLAPRERQTWRWSAELAGLVEGLAGQLAGGSPVASDRVGRVVSGVNHLPKGLGASILRLPSCFRSLDQRPEDCAALAGLLTDRLPDPVRSLLVVGIRTSGSYLAPLIAAHLRQPGRRVRVLTLRPGQDLFNPERAVVRAAVRDQTAVVICDDPPDSGRAFARAAGVLEGMGVRREDLTLLVPLLGPLPDSLRMFSAVTLLREQWWVEGLLRPSSVRAALGGLRIERLPLEGWDRKNEVGQRGHARALYRMALADGVERLVYAKGLGLGYLGRHASAVTGELSEYLPETLAVVDGVLFRRWLPEEARLDRNLHAAGAAVADRIAGYVADRAARLPATGDRSLLLTGRQPLWQRVADRIGGGFGGVRPLVRPAVHRLARRLLASPSPSVVDGSLALAEWFHAPDRGADRLGPGVTKVEGTLVRQADDAYVVSVAGIESIGGGSAHWSGEQVPVRQEYVRGVERREFSRGRTAVAIGAAAVAIGAFIATRGLGGFGSSPGSSSGGGGSGS